MNALMHDKFVTQAFMCEMLVIHAIKHDKLVIHALTCEMLVIHAVTHDKFVIHALLNDAFPLFILIFIMDALVIHALM